MNKFKNSIDKIELDKNLKAKMLDNIMNKKEVKKGFNFKKFAISFSAFIFAFTLLCGTGYALVKYFNLDKRFRDLYDIDDDIVDKIDGTDLQIKKEFDDKTIYLNQSIITENKMFITIDIKGKNKEYSLKQGILSLGETFDESLVDISTLDNDTFISTNENTFYTNSGFSMISLDDKSDSLTSSYILNFDFNSMPESDKATLRLYFDKDNYNDITFDIIKNTSYKKINNQVNNIQSKNGIIMTSKKLIISTSNIEFNYTVNDKNLLNTITEYGEEFTSYKVNFIDGTSTDLYLSIVGYENDDNSYTTIFGYKNEFINIDNIKSIIINNVEFNL